MTQELDEILVRAKRIETKLTGYLESQGYEAGGMKPVWTGTVIEVPTPSVSIRDCVSVIPEGEYGWLPVMCGETMLCRISLGDRRSV